MWNARNMPNPDHYDYVVAGREIRLSADDVRTTGQPVPEAWSFTKRNQLALLNTNRLVAVPKAASSGNASFVQRALGTLDAKKLGDLSDFLDIAPEDWHAAESKPAKVALLMRAAGFNIQA